MEDVARDELFEQVERLTVAESVQKRPEFFRRVNFLYADRRSLRARLQDPRRVRAFGELADALAVERVNEVGDEYAAVARLNPHRELVAEVARGGVTHAGQAQVLAKCCGGLNVEVIERHDAVNLARAREVADGARERVEREVGGHVEEFVNRLARPVGVPKLCARDEQDAAALSLALAHELLPLLVARDAQDCERALL